VVADDAEWQTRRISILGAVKSFIGQLTVGQDLLRVSLPSAFVYPYSGLELGATRALDYFELIQKANEIDDPVKRFLQVISYYVSKTKSEKFEKKPSNPILGENHYCWTETNNGPVHYLAEQVSHHPPISAYAVESKSDQINVLVNFESQGIKFYGNSVGITIIRGEQIQLKKFDETYLITKAFPDIWIRNVILGTKRESWEGEIVITCHKSNLRAVLFFKEEGWWCTNVINGTIYHDKPDGSQVVPIVKLTGSVSQGLKTVALSPDEMSGTPTLMRKDLGKADYQIVDYTTHKVNKLKYLPPDEWDDRSSLRIWREMFQAIVDDDMPRADAAKKVVEDAQRERRKNGTNFSPIFFALNSSTGMWEPRRDDLEHIFQHKQELIDSKSDDGGKSDEEK